MLFGIIGGFIFFIALNIDEKIRKEKAILEAKEGEYEVYFSF